MKKKSELNFVENLKIEKLKTYIVTPIPPNIPIPCFPEIVGIILQELLPKEWYSLNDNGKNFLKWISVKAEAIDSILPNSNKSYSKGFELLATNCFGHGFSKISEVSFELKIPSVLLRFSTLIVTFITVRLLLKKMSDDGLNAPSLIFTQNLDADYLNYPDILQKILSIFPESSEIFHFEVSEMLTEDYVSIIRKLAKELNIRFVLDDTNKMDAKVHKQLLDLADWIKIDYQATASIEKRIANGEGNIVLANLEQYTSSIQSSVLIFEGLGDNSPLKSFIQNNWKINQTKIYQQSRERKPISPWDKYFGLIQNYASNKFGLFYKGHLNYNN